MAAVDAIVLVLHFCDFYPIFRGQLASKFDGSRPFHPLSAMALCVNASALCPKNYYQST